MGETCLGELFLVDCKNLRISDIICLYTYQRKRFKKSGADGENKILKIIISMHKNPPPLVAGSITMRSTVYVGWLTTDPSYAIQRGVCTRRGYYFSRQSGQGSVKGMSMRLKPADHAL